MLERRASMDCVSSKTVRCAISSTVLTIRWQLGATDVIRCRIVFITRFGSPLVRISNWYRNPIYGIVHGHMKRRFTFCERCIVHIPDYADDLHLMFNGLVIWYQQFTADGICIFEVELRQRLIDDHFVGVRPIVPRFEFLPNSMVAPIVDIPGRPGHLKDCKSSSFLDWKPSTSMDVSLSVPLNNPFTDTAAFCTPGAFASDSEISLANARNLSWLVRPTADRS